MNPQNYHRKKSTNYMKDRIIRFFGNEKMLVMLLLVGLAIFFLIILSKTEGYIGGADTLTHYEFSRYSWLYPEFLLHHWAKPVFTLLTSPFAQFGHDGMAVFNLIMGLISCLLVWLTARKLDYKNSYISPILLMFMPIYTLLVLSGLTEVLFGLNIILTTYLLVDKKFMWAAIAISFSPLVRTEGIIMIPVFGLYFLIMKQWKQVPWLLTGSLIYSIIGYFYYNDFFWLITQMPYAGDTNPFYGTGGILYYFIASPKIFGSVSSFLFALGVLQVIGTLGWKIFKGEIKEPQKDTDEFLLIVLPSIIFFLAHMIMWWSGIGQSLGMHRYMISIMPLGAIMSLKAVNGLIWLVSRINAKKIVRIITILLILLLVVSQPFKILPEFPHKFGIMDKVMYDGANFILENKLNRNKIYFYDPAFPYFIGFNPYNNEEAQYFVNDRDRPQFNINEGSILIWDGHFSPIHGLNLDSLRVSPYFRELAAFEPTEPFLVFGTEYKVVIFQRNDLLFVEEK